MRRTLVLLALAGTLVACGDDEAGVRTLTASEGVTRSEADPAAPIEELAHGFNDAGFELWRTLPADDNVVFSPSSIGHALLMAHPAADAPTADAIATALRLPAMGAHAAWNAVDHALAEATHEEVEVIVADRIWPRTGLEPDQDWVDLLTSDHGAEVQTLDFAGDPDGSREEINAWVADRTRDLIPELIPDGGLDPSTVLSLTDTLYFKARWQTIFGKYGPETEDFTHLDGSTTSVEYMVDKELDDRRGRGDGFVGAEIPYAGGAYSMLVLVPDEGRFEEIRTEFDQALLDEIDTTFEPGPYELYLPRWEDDESIDLLPWLTDIGAAPGAYPVISPEAFLGSAVHGADIAVDEWGTVAAAATNFGFNESGAGDIDWIIRADHPFLYLIRHRDSGLVLFAGQVTDPAAG